jgi:hypothetical protein
MQIYRHQKSGEERHSHSGHVPPQGGMFAFSGGVDGTFALLRHHKARAGLRTARPVGAMLVHGFDIPLSEQQAFDRARANVADVIGALGLPLAVVRTNWRSEASKVWPREYLAGLSACLHQFRGLANVGVLGAGEDYAHREQPWGSNPITNRLLSGGGFGSTPKAAASPAPARRPHQRLSGDRRQAAGVLGRPDHRWKLRALREMHPHKLNFWRSTRRRPVSTALRPMRRSSAFARRPQQLALLRERHQRAEERRAWGMDDHLALAIAKNRLMAPAWSLQRKIVDKLRPQSDRQATVHDTRSALQVEQK